MQVLSNQNELPPLYEIDRVGLQYFSECKAVQNIAGTDKIEAFD